jgi:hypothetical protein
LQTSLAAPVHNPTPERKEANLIRTTPKGDDKNPSTKDDWSTDAFLIRTTPKGDDKNPSTKDDWSIDAFSSSDAFSSRSLGKLT